MKIKRMSIKVPRCDVRCILLSILVYVYMLFCICPQFIILNRAELIKTTLIAGICILIIICYNRLGKMNIFCLLYCLYLPVISYLAGKATIGNRYIALMFLPLGGILFDIYFRYGILSALKKMALFLLPIVFYVYVQTWRALGQNSYAVRAIKTYDEYSVTMRKMGVGGYEFIYFLTMLAILFWGCVLLKKGLMKKGTYLVAFLLCVLLILRSNYLTAAITVMVAVTVSVILFLIYKNKIWGGILFFVVGICALLHRVIINIGVEFLTKNVITSGKNYDRLLKLREYGLRSFLDILESEGRAEAYGKSIASIKDNVFLGLVFDEGGIFESISQHSFILDTFALFGAVIGIATCVIILSNFKKEFFKKEAVIITIPMLISTVIVLVGNNLTASIALVITIIYPCVVLDIERENSDGNKRLSETCSG